MIFYMLGLVPHSWKSLAPYNSKREGGRLLRFGTKVAWDILLLRFPCLASFLFGFLEFNFIRSGQKLNMMTDTFKTLFSATWDSMSFVHQKSANCCCWKRKFKNSLLCRYSYSLIIALYYCLGGEPQTQSWKRVHFTSPPPTLFIFSLMGDFPLLFLENPLKTFTRSFRSTWTTLFWTILYIFKERLQSREFFVSTSLCPSVEASVVSSCSFSQKWTGVAKSQSDLIICCLQS